MEMRLLFLIVLLALGCQDKTQARTSERRTPGGLVCAPSNDPFSCLRIQCGQARGEFNEFDLTCRCTTGTVFATSERGVCVPPSSAGETFEFTVYRERAMRLTVQYTEDMKPEILEALGPLSVPIVQDGSAVLNIYRDGAQLQKELEQLPASMRGEILNFYVPETYLYDDSLNAGVYNPVVHFVRHLYILPSHQFPALGADLDAVTKLIKKQLEQPLTQGKVTTFSSSGCAEICSVRYEVGETNRFTAYRIRLYSGGSVFDDHVTVVDSTSGDTFATFYLINGKLSHFLKRHTNGDMWLYGNRGEALILAQAAPKPEFRMPKNWSSDSIPVVIFEGFADSDIDRSAFYGPDRDSHFYGWFKPADQKPFYLGRNLVRFSEESGNDPRHGHIVGQLASSDFTQPLIPFFPDHLWSGDFNPFLKNFSERFVGSLSVTNTMTGDACRNSEMGQVLRATEERALWIVAAGNSARETSKAKSINCPQNLTDANLIVVAASSDGKTLEPISTSGEKFADIAENGCEWAQENCRQAFTSFAAPRLARSVADLMQEFPQTSLKEIRRAILFTARAPLATYYTWPAENRFLNVASGGVFDAVAARRFLKTSSSRPLLSRLMEAKAEHYPRERNTTIEKLITEQIERLQSLKENL